MVSDHGMDDIVRKKLEAVEPPDPPEMDWGAMAHAARTGTVRNGATGAQVASNSLMVWKIIAGAAVVGGLVWYGNAVPTDPSPRDQQQLAVQAENTTDGAVVSPASASVERSVVAYTADPSQAGAAQEMQRGLAATGNTTTLSRDAGVSPNATGAVRKNDVSEAMIARIAAPGEVSEGAAAERSANENSSDRMRGMDADQAGGSSTFAMHPTGGPGEALPSTASGMERITSIDRIEPVAVIGASLAGRPYPPAPQLEGAATFPRFAISPWVSLGRSYHSGASGAVADQAEQLGGLNELIGTAGVRVEYALDHRFAVISGVQYASKGGLQGTITTSANERTDYHVSGTYWEVPLSVKYTIPHEGRDYYVRMGALLQFNAHSGIDKVVLQDDVMKETSTLTLSTGSMGPALDIGVGVRFRLGHGIGLFVEPSYQYALSPMVKYPSFDRLPYNPKIHSFGLGTGITFQLHSR